MCYNSSRCVIQSLCGYPTTWPSGWMPLLETPVCPEAESFAINSNLRASGRKGPFYA